MKKIVITVAIAISTLTSCVGTNPGITYTDQTVIIFNNMEPPVILLSKTTTFGLYGVQLMDGNGNIVALGDMSSLANGLGESYNVGDTIK